MWVSTPCRVAFGCLLVMLNSISIAQAERVDKTKVVDLTDAITMTLERNPGLMAFGDQIRAQEARVTQSAQRPDPELGLMVENFVGTDQFSGIDSAEITLSVAWILERGKQQHRIDSARAGVSLFEAEAEIRRLDAAAETGRRFLDSLAFQERLTQTEHAVRLADETATAIRRRVAAGRTPDADLARAEAELARMRLDREDIEHSLRVSNRRLAAQWGVTQPAFTRVSGNIHDLPTPAVFSNLLARVDQTPNITRYFSEQRLRESELRLAEAEAKPGWRVTAGIRHFERSDDQALIAGVTIPLPVRNRNQGRISEARARLAMTSSAQAAVRVQIETQLFALYQELQHSLHVATTLRDEIVPRLERALVSTQSAYDAGRYGYFELRVVQTELLSARAELVEATIGAHRNVIEIERLTGTTVTSFQSQP